MVQINIVERYFNQIGSYLYNLYILSWYFIWPVIIKIKYTIQNDYVQMFIKELF